jgi:hypothetical protein
MGPDVDPVDDSSVIGVGDAAGTSMQAAQAPP